MPAKKSKKPASPPPKPAQAKGASQASKGGRPTKFTEAILTEICDKLSEGTPLAQICRDPGMPAWRTVYDWMDKDENVSAAIARAREVGHDAIAEEALQIADTPVEGIRTKVGKDGTEVTTEDMLGHRKLQIETRLKLLAKWNPKKYGDKLEVKTDAKFIPLGELATKLESESEEE
jgi:hypothetical protein